MKIAMLTSTLMFALLGVPVSAGNVKQPLEVGSPYNTHALKKVIELLEVMKTELEKENQNEMDLYHEKSDHHDVEVTASEKIIKENEDKIAQLKSDLEEAEAFRAGKKRDLNDLANQMAKNGAELSDGQKERKKEQVIFAKNEATFMESLDQLQRAVATLQKKAPVAPADSAAASASLISVAQKLEKTLTQSSDFSLNRMQRETLSNFVRTADFLGDSRNSNGEVLAAPSFVQTMQQTIQKIENQAKVHDPYGEFESKNSGVLGTLQELHGKVQTEKDAQLKTERAARSEFKTFESGLETMLENGKKSKEDIQMSISQSQQQSSHNEASLMEAEHIFKSESEHLDDIEAIFRKVADVYKINLGQRLDEGMAIHQANRILKNTIWNAYIKTARVENKAGAISLLQSKLKGTVRTPGLTFLALRATVHLRSDNAGPFGKVKSMIADMLSKLQDNQAKESEHAAWCDKEQGKTALEEERKVADVQKTKDRLEALQAELEETKDEIETGSKELAEMTASTAKAQELRFTEQKNAKVLIAEYRDSAASLRRACKVLKSYFEVKAEEDAPEVRSNDQKQRQGLSTGVIGILEIAVEDFEKLHKESKVAEDTAAVDFAKLESETGVRTAVYEKNIELKTGSKVKMEFDESTMQNDLKSYEKELANINSYMDELKRTCAVPSSSYEERKTKREGELQSLKQALAVITSRN